MELIFLQFTILPVYWQNQHCTNEKDSSKNYHRRRGIKWNYCLKQLKKGDNRPYTYPGTLSACCHFSKLWIHQRLTYFLWIRNNTDAILQKRWHTWFLKMPPLRVKNIKKVSSILSTDLSKKSAVPYIIRCFYLY